MIIMHVQLEITKITLMYSNTCVKYESDCVSR